MSEDIPTCPGCQSPCQTQHTRILQAQIRAYFDSSAPMLMDFMFGGDPQRAYRFFTSRSDRWACDACMDNQRAVKGNIDQQTFGIWQPHLAYVDQNVTCCSCQKPFTFTKEEQKHWYETLKFWVVSYATRCPGCRKARRDRKRRIASAQRELEKIRADFNPEDPEQLKRIIALYQQTGSHRQVDFHQRRLQQIESGK